jgi:PAS domain S-box-containing protein
VLAAHPVETESASSPASVVVGVALDDEFAQQMHNQTGLEHTLLLNLRPVATSLSGGLEARRAARFIALDDPRRGTMTLNNERYYIVRFPLAELPQESIEAEVALPVANITATQQSLVWSIFVGIGAVATVGSVLGIVLARRISRPLARLADAATTLSQGDLTRSVMVDTRVREVALVGAALEAARVDLNLTLNDLRREKAWTDHLLEAIVEGIVMLDRQGQIVFFSRGAERITGWSRDEVLGRACDEIFQTTETEQPFSQVLGPPQQRHKIAVNLRDDHPAILAITSAQLTIPEENRARLVLVFRDVSEAEAMHRLMGHFMANVTHEFRTPLSSVAASIELLLDQAPDLSAGELQELITSLHLGIVGLQTLVDNLLEGASIEAGRFRVYARPVNLNQMILEATDTMQPLLNKYGQRLVVDLPSQMPVVLADPRRTVQVLVNLLSNASKYGPDEAEVRLTITLADNLARVSIADRGPGIPPAYRDDLFRRFIYPAQDNDKTQDGMGLGLSVVKAIVEAQGGQVGVEDRPGGGSIFWFTLVVEHNA